MPLNCINIKYKMIQFESYQQNVDIVDKYYLNNIKVDKSILYNGNVKLVNKYIQEKCEIKIPTLAAAVLGPNNTSAPFSQDRDLFHAWTDIDSQELYLRAKPTCYLILSKPGLGAYSLGEAISKKLNCVHLCPKNIIMDELEQNSITGKCIEFNVRHNDVCSFNTILLMLKKKLESAAVHHRGYVISGFPLVTTMSEDFYLVKNKYSEESVFIVEQCLEDVLGNLKKSKNKLHKLSHSSSGSVVKVVEEEEVEEEQEGEVDNVEEEEAVVLPKSLLEPCSNVVTFKKSFYKPTKSIILEQFFTLMDLKMKPDIIIHLSSPDMDVVTRTSRKYYNYMNNMNTIDNFLSIKESELRWPAKYLTSDYKQSHDTHTFNPKYNCKQPYNFKEKSVQQLYNYRHHIYSFVEEKLKDYKPEFIIKVDGRFSIYHMLFHIVERLQCLPIKPVLIPRPLYLEETTDDMSEFWKSIEEMNVVQYDILKFTRYASPWFNNCPVELKKRHVVKGNPRFAVSFFKHVYIMSSLEAMISFCRNPRPFLQLNYLETTCRIIVVGTKSSGKTMICNCLSWIFDAPIICYKTFYNEEKQIKYDNYSRIILSEIIATIEDTRITKWNTLEENRLSNLDAWYNSMLNLLKKYIVTFKEYTKQLEEQEEDSNTEIPRTLLNRYKTYREQLSELPFLDDIEECMISIREKDVLISYAPSNYVTITEKPEVPVIGDDDVTEAIQTYIVANDLTKEIEPSPKELINKLTKKLFSYDIQPQKGIISEHTFGKWIIDDFPSSPEYWDYLINFKLLPDYTVALFENREIESQLYQNYITIENSKKNYQERFLSANDPLIKTCLEINEISDLYLLNIEIIVHELLSATLNRIFSHKQSNKIDSEEELKSFTESIDKFREDWDSIKIKLDDNFKAIVEVELEAKDDIQIIEEVLLKIRYSYFKTPELIEDVEVYDERDHENQKDLLVYNNSKFISETNVYCPIAYYNYGILWKGKKELCLKYDNKIYYLSTEDCLQLFQRDITKYQSYSKPFKKIPSLKICVIGCIGSGKTTISKFIAKELGLLHIDFADMINEYLLPKHFKRVGRKYENSFTDVRLDEETVFEFQMSEDNENLESDILANETELRRMIYNYFERGVPLFSFLVRKLIKKFWFEGPFSTTGFVLDGFPRLPSEVEDMISSFCIPDLILDMEGSSETTLERLSSKMFKTWKVQLNEARNNARAKLDIKRKQWSNFVTKNVVAKLIFEDIIASIPIQSSLEELIANESIIIDADPMGLDTIDVKLFNTYNDMINEYPEPIDETQWEKPEEARERINSRLEAIYESDDENIQTLKDMITEHNVQIIRVNGTLSLTKVLRTVLLQLIEWRNRTESFFEQTFIISCDIAEFLLSEGFYFLSKFNRICPVYLSQNPNAVLHLYKINKQKNKIFPVIHRSYIYYVNGENNVRKFRANPLKYIQSNIDVNLFVEHPLRIGIIGPPKSGKSELAAKLSNEYGLTYVSRGTAIRNVLEKMCWTELANKMLGALRKGECIEYDLIMKAVQVIVFEHRTSTRGFVFDGFPETTSEALTLLKKGLYPLMVFDLSSSRDQIQSSSQSEIYYRILKIKPPYSLPLINTRYDKWYSKKFELRNWIQQDVQNLYAINEVQSKWQRFQYVNKIILKIISKIYNYVINVDSAIVPADVLCITNEIFEQRMSQFKNMCPLCLRNNVLRYSRFPVEKKGLVQYKNTFYWICNNHKDEVLNHPDIYLIQPKLDLPEVAAIVNTVNQTLVYENGICIVTYAENLPSQVLRRGSNKHAASYRDKVFLFCSSECLKKFLTKPHLYCNIVVFKENKLLPQLSLRKLPDLGYLEQTLGNVLTNACCSLNALRPKYPGLDVKLSGLIYIGLYLKTHNILQDPVLMAKYLKAFNVYEGRSKLIINVGLRLRSMENPFADYSKYCHETNSVVQFNETNSLSISSSCLLALRQNTFSDSANSSNSRL